MVHRITLIPGDGIGPEVTAAARLVVESSGVEVVWDVQEAGAAVLAREGTPLPERVLRSIEATRTCTRGSSSRWAARGWGGCARCCASWRGSTSATTRA
ncbi:MAG TPA: isocitrate/isopropylmalate family dehydrogenase [Actinomycetota bacterium]|nr:isocitrate/isopropylmalate family dehydrogenase [Actinomycetota bacterium]